ncbi:MAG: MXAN_6640 family putative metalloprotease [Bacteroidota bacterium]
MKKLIFILLISSHLFAQSIETLYNSILTLGNKSPEPSTSIMSVEDDYNKKCGFGIISQTKARFNQFNTSQQKVIAEILSRPVRQKSVVSSSGIFRIHYDTDGIHAPNYFSGSANNIQLSLDSLIIALDSSYNFEINILGYIPPPDDEGDGGDNLYDIYISSLGSGFYGYTEYEKRTEDNRYKSYIVIDNKMNVPTPGINGARVTAAHEFHHAIQVGSYRPPLTGDVYYHEITSTSMEEFVYDNINDYYNYLPIYFRNPERRFTYSNGNTGYDRVIWNIYLKEKFEKEGNDPNKGLEIIKKSWEIMRNYNRTAIEAISLALVENGLNMKSSYNDFGVWCYFTNYRAQNGKYFSEASEYEPLIKPIQNPIKYQPSKESYIMNIQPLANNYMIFDLSYSGINDTLISIVTNGDIESSHQDPFPSIQYTYSLMTNNEDGAIHIVNEYYSKIESNSNEYLVESDIFNDQVVKGATITKSNFVYPQPYIYDKQYTVQSSLSIPVKNSLIPRANLYIYSISMDLVFSERLAIESNERVVKWNGLDKYGNKLSSGIYIYVTETDGQILKGKLAIINE